MKREFSEFCGKENGYSLSKTLRFELRPQGKTLEWIQDIGFLPEDEKRSEDYKEAKKIIDDYHRYYIDSVLSGVRLDWEPLETAIKKYQNDRDASALEDEQKKMRKAVMEFFVSGGNKTLHKMVTESTPNDLFNKIMPSFLKESYSLEIQKEKQKVIDSFKNFATYFTGFQENRKNVYSTEAIKTAISYRLVHENFPKFLQNREIFQFLEKHCPEVISNTEKNLSVYLNGKELKSFFSISAYNQCLKQGGSAAQEGIDFYNQLLGGIKLENRQIAGLNQEINLYWQQHSDFANSHPRRKMMPLYKQILSDRSTASFVIDSIQDDTHLKRLFDDFTEKLAEKINIDEENKTLFELIQKLVGEFRNFDFSKIFIQGKDLAALSSLLFGKWDFLQNRMRSYAEVTFKTKKEKEKWLFDLKEEESSKKSKKIFSLADLNSVLEFSSDEVPPIAFRMVNFFDDLYRWNWDETQKKYLPTKELLSSSLIKQIDESEKKKKAVEKILNEKNLSLKENESNIAGLKDYLDSLFEILHRLKFFKTESVENADVIFYSLFDPIYEVLSLLIPFYNKVRNYLTQKRAETKKYKLNFSNSTLAAGWDLNKENENSAILLKKDENYFLGIVNKKLARKEVLKTKLWKDEKLDTDCYQKMVYKFIGDPSKQFPRIFFAKGNLSIYNPSEEISRRYKNKEHTKNPEKGYSFDLAFCHQLIDFFKASIKKYEDWDCFNFSFSKTSSYKDLSDFYREVNAQGYKVDFINIAKSKIDQWVEEGKLFLFQIYNKDFSEYSKGKENLHTLYFRNLFSPENLEDPFLKLNGNAELFYREAAIKNPVVHKKDSILVNRTYQDKEKKVWNTLPDLTHHLLFKEANKELASSLSEEEKEALAEGTQLVEKGVIVQKKAKYDIIKDRRYTIPKFMLHVSININQKAQGNASTINKRALFFLRDNPNVNVIGLDRGERNLIYLSLINPKGEILLQKSYNLLSHSVDGNSVVIDYHAKLDQREKDRDRSRKSWQTIGKIKELKEGYLSAVIHEIVSLMVQHNAIIVMEDLNFGFKRGRFFVEKQVYQKFEKMLIDKLNYLVFKTEEVKKPGGVLNGYQLSNKFESFQKMGKQTGFIFYVRSSYTSKIDPKTGFVEFFNLKNLTNVSKKREFFAQFDSICYDTERKLFKFEFDYKKWKGKAGIELAQTKWAVYSNGERIQFMGKNKEAITVNLSQEFFTLLKQAQIPFEQGEDLKKSLNEMDDSRNTIAFFDQFYRLFKLCLQLRNSNSKKGDDYIISPVMDEDGNFFDSREEQKNGEGAKLPIDADANGAYHIALKGLLLIERINQTNDNGMKKIDLLIKDKDWFAYRQKS